VVRVKSKRQANNKMMALLREHGLKLVLGTVATVSFANAFGVEKFQQLVSFSPTSSTACLDQFYNKTPPYLMRESQQKHSYPLCFNGFNVMYSGVSKTPLWVAEYLNPTRLSQKIPREDSFHEEQRVASAHRATLQDYKGSGYDRGHMAPNADMPNVSAQFDSFSLANMVPQAPKNNQKVWRELEEATRAMVTKQKQDVYLVTGPAFTAKKLKKIGNGVIVPTAVFKAVYLPKTGVTGAYYAPNDNSLTVNIVSICYLEEQLGINLFPNLSEDQKRNTYKLPRTASEVKANQKIAYSHWDAESQCAEDVLDAKLSDVQKQFKSQGNVLTAEKNSAQTSASEKNSSATTTAQDENPVELPQVENAIVKQLFNMLLEFILQLLK
jgi:endonuclease G, mitochondrial